MTDNAPEFPAQAFNHALALLGVKHIKIRASRPGSKAYALHCTSFVLSERSDRRRNRRGRPCDFRGAFSVSGSYK